MSIAVLAMIQAEVGEGRVAALPLAVSHDENGFSIVADDAPLEEVLAALADMGDFDVAMQDGVDRPFVDVEIVHAPLEEVLSRVLWRRNYAIFYRHGSAGNAVSRVEVLMPPRETVSVGSVRPGVQSVRKVSRTMKQQRLVRQLEAQREAGARAFRPEGNGIDQRTVPVPLRRLY